MKIKTHLKLAHLSLANSKEAHQKHFNRPFFYLGVILADMSWLSKTHPHYASRSLDYIQNKIHQLMNKKLNAYHSMQFGIIMHYLCDFCCVAHQSHSVGNLKAHISYERALAAYMNEHIQHFIQPNSTIASPNADHFNYFLENHLKAYRKHQESYHWDLHMATQLGTTFCHTILS